MQKSVSRVAFFICLGKRGDFTRRGRHTSKRSFPAPRPTLSRFALRTKRLTIPRPSLSKKKKAALRNSRETQLSLNETFSVCAKKFPALYLEAADKLLHSTNILARFVCHVRNTLGRAVDLNRARAHLVHAAKNCLCS